MFYSAILRPSLRRMTRLLPLALLCCYGTLSAQQAAVRPFKALCISDKETGFNWKSGDWVQTNFNAGEKLLVQKLAMPNPFCKEEVKSTFSGVGVFLSKGCYLINVMGSPPTLLFDTEMCDEFWEEQSIRAIHCRRFSFHPDGRFIRLPWHSDISNNPKNDNKDSLVLSVGKCSRLAE
jgi:hypothetical protein